MTRTPIWRRYLTFWRANIENDVADELAFHAEMRIEEYMARGMSDVEARRAVAERLGDVAAARDECLQWGEVRATHVRRASIIDGLRSDVRYALRSLRRTPAWTAVALLTIALGVGATTTVFSVADRLLVRTLPYPDASRVYLAQRQFSVGDGIVPVSLPFGMAKIWREQSHTIEGAALAGADGSGALVTTTDSLQVNIGHAERELFEFAGVRPLVGRVPSSDELAPSSHLMLLTEQLWRTGFGAAPDVVGRAVKLRGEDWTVVGVMPASFSIPVFRAPRADVVQLVGAGDEAFGAILVRLRPGVTRETATAELDAIVKRANLPDQRPGPMPLQLRLTRPQDWLAIRQPLVMLTAAVALLLMVACTNVAHLLLARGAARQREFAVRHALGAGRARLVRQLATESLVIAVFGGVFAIFVGWAGLHVLTALRPAGRNFDALTYVSPNRGLIAIGSALAIGCGLVVGIVAALRIAHRDLAVDLRIGASTKSGERRLRSLLVVGEVAVSATLLVAALLLVHSLFALEHADIGFDPRGLYGISVSAPRGTPPPARAAMAATLRDRFAHAPGVESAVITDRVPGGPGFTALGVWETPDHPRSPAEAHTGASYYVVPSEFFATMRMPVTAGRTFDGGAGARNEIVVSRSLAKEVAGDANPIGLRIRNAIARTRGANIVTPGTAPTPTPDEPWQTIVGVVPDMITNLTQSAPTAAIFRPLSLSDSLAGAIPMSVSVLVRDRDANAATRLAKIAAGTGGDDPPATIVNVHDAIDATLMEPTYVMRVLVVLALLGVVLAAIGLFGVISYSVGRRTREIGVRMALGATRPSIAYLVIGDGIRLAAVGVVAGLAGSLVMTRLVQSVIHGVSRFDPVAFGGGALLLLLIAVIACVAPTWRATAIDPALAVRAD